MGDDVETPGGKTDASRTGERAITRRGALGALAATAGGGWLLYDRHLDGREDDDAGTGSPGSGSDGEDDDAVESAAVVATLDLTGDSPSTSAEVPGGSTVVFFVHGWLGTRVAESQAGTLASALSANEYDHPVVAVRWPARDLIFSSAQSNADVAGEQLAAWIGEFLGDHPDSSVRLVGHSLGGRVLASALASVDGDLGVDSLSLLGAAVTSDAVCPGGRYHDPIDRAQAAVFNYYSSNDGTVCDTFGESGSGLGCAGASCDTVSDNYADVDVSDQVSDHGAYTDPDQGCIDRVVRDFEGDTGTSTG